jgi:glycosyltransferase involved in cell wall biosynthesis
LIINILILTHISPPAIDGGSKVIHQIGDYLLQKGHSILRISSDCSSTDDFTHPYQPVNSQLPVYTIFHRPLKLFKLKGPVFKLIPFIKATIKIIKFKPQLIIAGPLPTAIIFYAKFFQKLTGAKLLVNPSFHPSDPEFQNPIFLQILKSANYLWTLTNHETNYFKKLGFKNTLLLGNGVDQSFIIDKKNTHFPQTPNLLFIGSFAAHKGLDQLINLLPKLPNITLTIAGQPTLYSPHLNFSHSRLKLVIKPSDRKIKQLLDHCTALVLPSTQESFGLVLIEAMARGKPVLVNQNKSRLAF